MVALPPAIYSLVQKLFLHGVNRRYIPLRKAALGWDALPERDILEIGCGTGLHESRGVALDLDPKRVQHVHRLGRPALVADATRLPFADRSFSVVHCEGVLHHIDDLGAAAALAEMLRVSRSRVVFMDSVWPDSRFRLIPWMVRRADFGRHVRNEAQLRTLLNSSGGKMVFAERLTYTTIGLECLLAVLEPAAASVPEPAMAPIAGPGVRN